MTLLKYIKQPVSIAPLVIFRIAFGALLFISTLRFLLKGWVHQFYVLPKMYFPFYGFEWLKPLPENFATPVNKIGKNAAINTQ